ncbi:MAG: type II toxin-antitoxin system VapC family toxin [Calditrichaeota bacterium]|nr:MAG: type II toxin-antitoxin system VapC family toxin [Calditrichota bacterium]MBL1207770.1 type II toxin-antitoxin system VapC family toxin [Calditrichota bacterium]NOG47603.1 PIN domain-containing protein [Calditrichota bacterium]
MGIIIDTNIFFDAENSRFDLKNLEKFSNLGESYISVITVSELFSGVHLAKSADQRIRRTVFVENVVANMPILDIDFNIAKVYSELFAHAISSGKRTGTNVHDLQIAATAISGNHVVLTRNIKNFESIPGVRSESPY